MKQVSMTANGILYTNGDTSVYLDPRRVSKDAINFVSHAHSDHLPRGDSGTILSTLETSRIADLRGVVMQDHTESVDCMSQIDAGHILGSTGLLVDDLFYTGDICTRHRGFLKPGRVPQCQTLITECTFGLPEFDFPDISEIQEMVNKIISESYSRGIPVLLMGYALGKAQTLSQLFGHWDPLYYHDDVKKFNDLHRQLGVELRDAPGHTQVDSLGLLDQKPWVMICPMMSSRNEFVRNMKSRHGAITIGFSGWAKSSSRALSRRCDYSIPLSDHCDFDELTEMVVSSGAKKVYTVHGFKQEFAQHLCSMGIDAQPL